VEQTFIDLKREEKFEKYTSIQGWISEVGGYDFRHVLKVSSCPLVNRRNPTFSNGAVIHFGKAQYLSRPPRGKPDLN
jgi:hypothetical protein